MKLTFIPLFLLFSFLLFKADLLLAVPLQTTYHIKVDQFGYLPNSRKVAVIADPQVGYNAAEAFNPGTGDNQYQIRRWSDDAIVFSGTLQVWNSGATHTQSGDRGWWFDFSAVTTPGSYYVFDVANNIGSFAFDISNNVYNEVLKQAMRTFFYQRINFAKQSPFTDKKWADGAWFEGPNQERFATSRYAKGDLSTAKDVHGGWMDAGDLNKYTTFAASAVIQLVEAYRINPSVFKDDYNIPESGNGIPDILDEVKWELDFLKRMQDATGTNGFLLKVGVDNYNEVSPPSTDTRPRYYLPECTSATIFGCSMFAVSGVTYKSVPALSDYGLDLIRRAELAWARAKETTANFTTWQIDCDDRDIKSGDADRTAEQQLDNAFVAAVYLYEATGKSEYKAFAEANYTKVNPYKISWWGPYYMPQQLALLRLTTLPNISSTVVSNILNQKSKMENLYSIPTYTAATDLYRAHLNDEAYHWGHNQARADAGITNLDYVTFGLNTSRHEQYKEVAEQYLHWMHGVNPMGMVMLSNMYQYGAEKCANEIFHRWYKDGSVWDNAVSSPNGPVPGYVPGGPNKRYSGSLAGVITDQPHQKAYKDWNTDWPENSYEITEPAIYYQAPYVMLLARLIPPATTQPVDTEAPSAPLNLAVSNITQSSVDLSWTASADNVGVVGYDVYQAGVLLKANITSTATTLEGLTCATSYSFTVKAKDAAGNSSEASSIANAVTKDCTTLTGNTIYDDALQVQWQDISVSSTRNFSNTSPVKAGSKSIKVDYAANGTLSFSKDAAAATTSTTELRFWVYNNSRNGIKVYTESDTGIKSIQVSLKPARGKWVEVILEMSQLGSPTNIKKVIVQNNSSSAATFYFDELRLVNVVSTLSAEPQVAKFVTEKALQPVEWDIYPNPAKEYAVVHLRAEAATYATVSVTDSRGRTVHQQAEQVEPGLNKWRIALPKLSPGVYYVKVTTSKHSHVKAIVVL